MQITCVIPLTRPWMLDTLAEQILAEQNPSYDLDILIICDNIHIPKWQIQNTFDSLNHKIVYTEKEPTNEINLHERRQRITDTYNLARHHIPPETKYVWTLEDDTITPPETLKRLLSHMTNKTGLATGIQAGRHAFKIVGLWDANIPTDKPKRHYPDPTRYHTPPYQPDGQTYIHASGLYCMLTQAHLFKTTPFRHSHLGPDFYYGWDIHKKGFYNIADWTIKCGHKTQNTTIYPDYDCIETLWDVQPNNQLHPTIIDKLKP